MDELEARCEDVYQAALYLLQLRDERPLRLAVVDGRIERLRVAGEGLKGYLQDVRKRAKRRAMR